MSELTRRRFLWSAGAAAGGIGLAGGALGQDQPGDAAMVPMDVEPTPGWLTWIGATTSCLRALGCECDAVDVAGMTGYAFILNIPNTVGVWGPTGFPWCLQAKEAGSISRVAARSGVKSRQAGLLQGR